MDAAAILSEYDSNHGALAGEVQYGPMISAVTIHKVTEHGLVFSGRCIPHLNSPVTVMMDDLKVEGIISSRNDERGALLFLRPVPKH